MDGSVAANQLGSKLEFATNSNASGQADTATVRMTIKNDGKVGILDTNPSSELTVNGDIETSTTGKVYSKGNCVQTSFHSSLIFGY